DDDSALDRQGGGPYASGKDSIAEAVYARGPSQTRGSPRNRDIRPTAEAFRDERRPTTQAVLACYHA
ncbi:MAG: hypothetical protein ACON5J_18920, partial [Rubripirellula sp.]